MTRPLLVAIDLDGTTITHSQVLTPAVAAAVEAARKAGHHVTVATGRAVVSAVPIIRALGIESGYAVCSNGAVTLRLDPDEPEGYEIIDTVTFDPGPALALLRDAFPDALVAVEEVGVGAKVNAPFPSGELDGEVAVVPWEELLADPVTRVTLRMPEMSSEDFLTAVEQAGLHGVSYAVGWTAWLDLNPEGVSKASALELVRRRLHVEPGETVAVGDQRNDLEMLRWAARGVAMGNAPHEVAQAADEVTGHVDDDGLAHVLRSLPGVSERVAEEQGRVPQAMGRV